MRKPRFTAVVLAMMQGLWGMASTSGEQELADSTVVHELDGVVVVSNVKEPTALREIGLSSTTFGADAVARLGDVRDLANYVPGFVMPVYGSRYTSSLYVRGVGSRVNNPSVSMYVDGIPLLEKSEYNSHLHGVGGVDFLRGPQGTLYGMNSECGLVRVWSKSPLGYQGTDLLLGYGMQNSRRAEVGHYAKLGQHTGLSVAGFYAGDDGFLTNTATGGRADSGNEAGGRLRLQGELGSGWTLDAVADYQWVRENGFAYGLLDAGDGSVADPSTNRQGHYQRNMVLGGLTVRHAGQHADFSSTTSYQFLRDAMLMDIDYLPGDWMHMEQCQQEHGLTEELAFRSRGNGRWQWTTGAFASYLWQKTQAPVYFDNEMNRFLSQTIQDYAYYGMLNSMANRYVAQGMSQEQATQMAAGIIERAGGCSIDMQIGTIPGSFFTPRTNVALFHESTLQLANRLRATLGLRWDWSEVAIDYRTEAEMTLKESVMGVNVNAAVRSALQRKHRRSYNELLPKVGLSYDTDERGSNLYVALSKGYRAGGYNIQMFSDILQTELQGTAQTARGNVVIAHDDDSYDNILHTIAYKPETSWNYEFGTHQNLADGRLQADFAGFYTQVKNQQLSVMSGNYGFGRMMTNAGRSYSCGVELSLRGLALADHLSWGLSYGYTRAVFKEYADSVNGEFVDYKDKRVPFVPEHTLAAMADYRFDFGNRGLRSLTVGANVSAQGKIFWDEANTYSQKVYAVAGAHADADFGAVRVTLWGRNLTDTKYNTFAFDSSATGQRLFFAQLGRPFQAGVDVSLHF